MLSDLVLHGRRGLHRLLDWPSKSSAARLDVLGALARMERQSHPPVTLVPIHNAPIPLARCLDSLVRHAGPAARIILIDDASTDPAVGEVLARFAPYSQIEMQRNATNLGFTRTVNRGLELAGRSDVVLLNSDTEVTPRWLQNLRLAAYSADRIGTATPFSNNAGAFSAPQPNDENPLPLAMPLDDYARLVTRNSARTYPRIPTGSGFCMYLRRDCLDEVGPLDAEAFPRGYGEENDFCMRASRRGWSHVIDDATLIYHVRSASFGDEKLQLMQAGRAILDRRYADYAAKVRAFARDRQVRHARQRVGAAEAGARSGAAPVRPRVLVYPESPPGSPAEPKWKGDRIMLRLQHGRLTLLGTGRRALESATFSAETASGAPAQARLQATVANWLVLHAVEAAEISAGSPFGHMMVQLCARLGIPVAS